MRELGKELKYFWSQKCFAVGILVVMLLSYATLLHNPTVGIDDTSFKIYYVDGVSPAMGRWCLYMINKVFPLDYNPYFVEAVGLLCFCVSISLWCIVFYRMFGDRLSVLVYTIFGGVMISSPIISEVVIWYLQDGIYLGYGATALAVLLAMDAFRVGIKENLKSRVGRVLASAVLLTVALGFYEAFMIVFLMGIVMIFLLIRVLDREDYSRKPLDWLVNLAGIGVSSMVFRSLAINGIVAFFDLESQAEVLETRGFGDILGGLLGWFAPTAEGESLFYVFKDFFVKYYCNAIVYVPIMILVLAVGVVGLWGILKSIQKKDVWIILAVVGIVLLPWLLPILEGVATYYRSSEYIPLLTAFAVLVIAWEGQRFQGRKLKVAGLFLAALLLYHQAYEMNKWLYVDAMKYEDTKRTMDAVALEIMESCDISKPVCVIGSYQTPESLVEAAYCPTWSGRYRLISAIVKGIDEEIFAKYDTPKGYVAAESPLLSFINWGAVAFYGFDRELIKFWEMHGFSFVEDGDIGHYYEAKAMMQNGPVWPEKGSIVETEDYIIVNFGN